MRTIALLLAASLLCSCASDPQAAQSDDDWKKDVKDGTQKAAAATVRGAEAVGDSVGTAYHGVTNGFAEPEIKAYGPYPRDYVNTIRKHMLRWEGVKESASFQFGKPVRGYLNKGLLRGGTIDWQGWVIDLSIETKNPFAGPPHVDEYVVRMKEGDVVEVIEKRYSGAVRRVAEDGSPIPPPAPAAPKP